MRVLVACEHSGVVRRAFDRLGHDAWSCDLLPDSSGDGAKHMQDDVLLHLEDGWDLMIAHPPCTYLCSSGLHWNKRRPGREEKTHDAMLFVMNLAGDGFVDNPIPRIAVENPVGRIGTAYRPADQYIQPYEFGEDASKKTGLWLKNLPPLMPTKLVQPRWVDGRPRWANQTDSGQNRLGPSADRWAQRSRTYSGIAEAMADQWGHLQ